MCGEPEVKHPECWNPEPDNPYPLCLGAKDGTLEAHHCAKCLLYANYDEPEPTVLH